MIRKSGGQFAPAGGGQFAPARGGQFDRHLHIDTPAFVPSMQTGITILVWCNEGIVPIEDRIAACETLADLISLRDQHPEYHQSHNTQFVTKRDQLQ